MANANQIQLAGEFTSHEAVAAGTITPGHLIEVIAAGTVQVHATEGGPCERAFAVEDALQGNVISDDYSALDQVFYNIQQRGSRVQAWLKAGETAVIGSQLISAGDGTLILNGSESSNNIAEDLLAEATEAVDLSGSGAVATRIDIRII